MSSIAVSTTINDDEVEFLCNRMRPAGRPAQPPWADWGQGRLRHRRLRGLQYIMDGRVVCSCLVLGAEAQGRTIETIEGMANGSDLHPLQSKFIEHAALQCGICTPGFLVAAKALLETNPNPSETEIRFWLAGNLCRCTGYDKIVRAVQDAAAEMRGESA